MSEKPQFVILRQQNGQIFNKVPYTQTNVRWLALFMACMLTFGDAYAFDNPMALQSTMQKDMNLNNLEFNMLYSVYSLPNMVLPFFGGIMIDKLGVRFSILTFSTVIIVGQLVVVISGYLYDYYGMLVGRSIFGIGSESLNNAQAAIISHWFKGKSLSLALGVCLSAPKLGSAFNSFMSPYLQAQYDSLGFTLLFSLFVLIGSWFCGLILIQIDRENERRQAAVDILSEKPIPMEVSMSERLGGYQKQNSMMSISSDDSKQSTTTMSPMDSPQIAAFNEMLLQTPDIGYRQEEDEYDVEEKEIVHLGRLGSHPKEVINFKDIQGLNGSFWILACIIMLCDALFIPFLDNGNAFLQAKYNLTSKSAGMILTIPYLLSSVVTPLTGFFVDAFQKRTLLIILTCLVFVVTHIFLLSITCDQMCGVSLLPLFSLGICYSLYSAVLIPSIPKLVKSQMIGTAFGLVSVFQNTALTIFPLITGNIFNNHLTNKQGLDDPKQGYFYSSIFFVGMSLITLLIAVTLHFVDTNGTRKLNTKSQ